MLLLNIVRWTALAAALAFPIQFAKSEQLSEYSNFTNKDLYCLTKNIYHEARGESYLGKLAVAQVTINRLSHPSKWPSTLCEVVYQQVRGVAQFSWTTMQGLKVTDSKAWYDAKQIAFGILNGDLWINNFNHTHFHNKTIEHGQKRKGHRIIGNHVFYHQ
jgi:spore germination cell wall hydrolase CwlJ-like protein